MLKRVSRNVEAFVRNPPCNAVQLWAESAEVEDGLKETVLAMTRDKSEGWPSAKQCLEMAWLCENGQEHSLSSNSTVSVSTEHGVCSNFVERTHPDFSQLLPAENRESLPPTEESTPFPEVESPSSAMTLAEGEIADGGPTLFLSPKAAQSEVVRSNATSDDM